MSIEADMKLDTTKDGLYTLFKPYQVLLLEHIWELNENEKVGVNSSRAHGYLLTTSEKKSRASVIFFLNDLVEIVLLVLRPSRRRHPRLRGENRQRGTPQGLLPQDEPRRVRRLRD